MQHLTGVLQDDDETFLRRLCLYDVDPKLRDFELGGKLLGKPVCKLLVRRATS